MSTSNQLDVRQFINARTMSSYQWGLVLLCFLIVAVDGMDVAIMGFVAPSIMAEWQVSRTALGVVMGAAPIGLALGALIAGPLSDCWGRRTVLLSAVLGFGVMTLATSWSNNLEVMWIMRLTAGLALGAAMPNSTTLLSEFVPERLRSVLLATMFTGFNLGSALIGFAASWLIPHHEWRSVLVFGGALPLLLLPVLWLLLPESARFMVARGRADSKVRSVLQRVCRAEIPEGTRFLAEGGVQKTRQPIAALFVERMLGRTLALWITYFMGLLVIYLATSWLPTMIRDAGGASDRAAFVTAMFQLGGTFGAIVVGFSMDRFGAGRAVSMAYFIGAISLLVLAAQGLASPWLSVLVTLIGFCLSGAQTGLNAYAPACYPTLARATGVSWMQGVGRLGSIFGSTAGGVLLGMGLGSAPILAMLAIPAGAAALAVRQARAPAQD